MAKVTVSISLNDKADRDIITWLDKIPNRQKSAAIRDILREHLRGGVMLADIYREVREINSKLAAGVVATGAASGDDTDEPADVAATLDSLGL